MHCVRRNSAKSRCTAPGEVPSPIEYEQVNRLSEYKRRFHKKDAREKMRRGCPRCGKETEEIHSDTAVFP